MNRIAGEEKIEGGGSVPSSSADRRAYAIGSASPTNRVDPQNKPRRGAFHRPPPQ